MVFASKGLCALAAVAFCAALAWPASAFANAGAAEKEAAPLVSANGDAALLEDAAWGLSGFVRAQAGSSREVGGVWAGYNYYADEEAGSVAVVATEGYAVVYVPESEARSFGLDAEDPADQAALLACLAALDEANSRGSACLSEASEVIFAPSSSVDVGGVRFLFDQELSPGRFYACVIGVDGSDVTDLSNPAYAQLAYADFARLTVPADVAIAGEPTGAQRLAAFLGGIDYSPLWVTLKTTGTAIVFVFALGLAAAYFTLRVSPRARDLFDSVFTIPMVLPPTVCGFLLLLAFGGNTSVGRWFMDVGFPLVFSWPATVIAAVVVAFPLMYRSARGAFEGLDPRMLDAARTLGWSERKVFFRLMLPLSWSSIAAGTVLAFARALGEFGATLFIAGNYLGVTRTIPIAIYFEWMNANTDVALFWTLVIMLFSFAVILFINLWSRRAAKYRQPSP